MPDIASGYSEEGFHRQRRNLIVGSIALFLYHIANIHVAEGQGSLLGLPVTIGKPQAIQWLLFVAVLYWALRFFQYRLGRPIGLVRAAHLEMAPFLERHALANIQTPNWRALLIPPQLPQGQRYELVPFSFHVEPPKRHRIEARVTPAWHILEGDDVKESRNAGSEYRAVYKGRVLWTARVVGYTKAIFGTPAFTDYILPYIFFVASIGYAGYRLIR